jgi:hypothetical protein
MTLRDFNFYIGMLSELGEVVPLILIFLFFLKGFKTNFWSDSFKIIVVYIALSFTIKVLSMINFFKVEDNLIFYAVLGLTEVVLLSLFFISESAVRKKVGIILLSFLVVINIYFIAYQLPGVFNSAQWSSNYIVLLSLSLALFYQFYQSAEVILPKNMLFSPAIILNFGFIFYFCGSFFVYLMAWYMLSQKAIGFFANGWIFVSLSNIVKIMFITIYFYRSFIQAKASRN